MILLTTLDKISIRFILNVSYKKVHQILIHRGLFSMALITNSVFKKMIFFNLLKIK